MSFSESIGRVWTETKRALSCPCALHASWPPVTMIRNDTGYKSDKHFIDEEQHGEEAFGLLDGDDESVDDVPAAWITSHRVQRRGVQKQKKHMEEEDDAIDDPHTAFLLAGTHTRGVALPSDKSNKESSQTYHVPYTDANTPKTRPYIDSDVFAGGQQDTIDSDSDDNDDEAADVDVDDDIDIDGGAMLFDMTSTSDPSSSLKDLEDDLARELEEEHEEPQDVVSVRQEIDKAFLI